MIFEYCSSLKFSIFPNSYNKRKIGICKCLPIGRTSKFFQFPKILKIWMSEEQKISIFPSTLLTDFFYHFRTVNSKNSENWTIMVDSLWSPKWVMLTKTSLGKGHTLYFGFMREHILIEDLVGPRTLENLPTILRSMIVAETKVLVTKVPLLSYFVRLWD